ncbi:MAG TPA: outer membrane lipid asymmetry maintenance protein MlaD [Pseudomonadales bacterium]|nr:outer membrane lipid asymmetry maintenance protein MlaD [Pseudomonadales bacterium]HMY95772.1 outer membrane lipid asymmetry maintenance protein MlaD [Pseudomonadales bacterium]HMZ70262.1 outer membrane lipid asymmetry maintenance protein MlaD [Pseudomonadales bacterium]HMZ90832.1 outer membrane lipid asymmetry maintenance protein MlaD [Pseudomonadales bacterium]HNB83162.1 outer membrane lipid asymmetry maintenance protein MlaD [Pseudomonadales bacterium]
MQTRTLEILVGLFLLLGAAALTGLALRVSGLSLTAPEATYTLYADFQNIGGLKVRAPVTVAGVEIGSVTTITLDQQRYVGHVTMQINASVNALPVDSAAMILTQGMLGQQYIGISIGAEEKMLSDGNRFKSTQSALVLEDLIGKFLTSSIDKSGSK